MRAARAVMAVVGLVGCVACAGQSSQPQATATLQLTTREVVMDIVVLDAKGHSVQGLSASDFRVVEDGAPQTIRNVSEHRAMTAEEVDQVSPVRLPPNTFTNFVRPGNTNSVNVIVIDALDTPLVAQMYLRQQLIGFMKTVPPGNLFAIFQMDASGMHLVQGFTSDPVELLKAVESKRDSVIMRPPMVYRKERKELLNEGLREMGRYLAGVPGRKNLIWFAGEVPRAVFGLSGNPFPDAVDYDMQSAQAANAISLSRVAMYPIDDRGLEMRWHPFNQMELERIANATGGKAFFNTNGLKEALTQITETGSNYYTIAYAPTNTEWHAHHRDVEIAVPGRPDVKLLYRHRYYARKEGKAQRVADQRQAKRETADASDDDAVVEGEMALMDEPSSKEDFATSMLLGQMPAGELLFSVSVSPTKGVMKLGKNDPLPQGSLLRADFQRKPFRQDELLFVIDPNRVHFELQSDGRYNAELEIVTVLYDNQGQVLNSISTVRQISFDAETYGKVLRHELTVSSRQMVDVPEKVNAFFRFGVYDTASERIGTMEVPVDNVRPGVTGQGLQTP
jgi:VWFA-related protein